MRLGRAKDLSLNFLSLSPETIIIEECEIDLYNLLTELGFDVITVPMRTINEFGGSIHCSTLDLKREGSLKDYFPNQNYEDEVKIDYSLPFKHTFITEDEAREHIKNASKVKTKNE